MNRRIRWMTLCLGIVMTILFIPMIAFADDEDYNDENDCYNADYYGAPELEVVAGGELSINYMDNDDYVIIHTEDEDIRCDFSYYYNYDYDYGYYELKDNKGNNLMYEFGISDEDNKVHLWIYVESLSKSADAVVDNAYVFNRVSSIEFYPVSNITLYSEDIKSIDEDGYVYLDIRKRSIHSHEGETWPSAFAVGDKLVVHYDNGRTKTFINKDYYDEEEYQWTDAFFCGDEPNYDVYMFDNGLLAGNNTVVVEHNGRQTIINVTFETPESRAAAKAAAEAKARAEAEAKAKAEAEAKAKADAAAKAKAAALKKASNINKATVSASDIRKASKLGATSITLGAKVKKIKANAFKGTKIKTITIKTKKLKAKTVKGSFKSSKVKTIIVKVGNKKANKQYVKAYKKIFTKKIVGKKVGVK